jgi:hypothetical protein
MVARRRYRQGESVMNIQILEVSKNQAWSLRVKLYKCIENECIGRAARSTPSVRKKRLRHAFARAHARFIRRQDMLICAEAMQM